MNNMYAECLVKRKKRAFVLPLIALSAAGALIFGVSVLHTGLLGIGLSALMCLLIKFLLGICNVEYEYLLAEKEFSVDVIYNRVRRKRMGNYKLEEVLAVGPEQSSRVKEYERQVKKTSDYSGGEQKGRRYALIHQKNGICEKIIIEPDECMIKCFKMMAPRIFTDY